MSKLASFKTPFTTIAYGPSIALEGTAEPNHVPSYVFNHHLNTWQVKQNCESPINEIGHTNVSSLGRPTFQVGYADPQHGKENLP